MTTLNTTTIHSLTKVPTRVSAMLILAAASVLLNGCAHDHVSPFSGTNSAAQMGGSAQVGMGDEPFPAATPKAVVTVTKAIFPAVVRIDVAESDFKDGRKVTSRSIGSGVIFDNDGRILTNFHVAGRATEIHVTLFNKERVRGTLLGSDHWTDLAVIQLDMDEIRAKKLTFSHADFGDSSILVPGQDVMAIGTPFGLARTMTLGTVSNVERTLYPEHLDIDGYETGGYSNWIQMDVPINPGNSGGPLVDLSGKVVGINTRGGAQNLNFAVPINTAKPIVEAIVNSYTPDSKGKFERSDLGIDFKPMQDLESFYKLDSKHGVLINSVDHYSAAEAAGVQPQDVLLAINGMPINVRFPEELATLMQQIASLPVGKPVVLTLQRGGKENTLTAVTDRLQGNIGEEGSADDWGISVAEVTRAYASDNQLDSASGVIVSTIKPDSPASKANLSTDDVIIAIDNKQLTDLASFKAATKLLNQSKSASVLLTVRRGRGQRSIILKPTYKQPATDAS